MSRDSEATKTPANMPQPINWSEVKALLEAQDKKITIVAEGIADIQKTVGKLDRSVNALSTDVKDIKSWLQLFDKRLTAVEK